MPLDPSARITIDGNVFQVATRRQRGALGEIVPHIEVVPVPAQAADPTRKFEIPLDQYGFGSGHSYATGPGGYDMTYGLVPVNDRELRTWGAGFKRTFTLTGEIEQAWFVANNEKVWLIGGNEAARFAVSDIAPANPPVAAAQAALTAEETHTFPDSAVAAGPPARFGGSVYVPLVDADGAAQPYAALNLTTEDWTSGPATKASHVLYSDGTRLYRSNGNVIESNLTNPALANAWGGEATVGDTTYNISALGQWDRFTLIGRPDGFWTLDSQLRARRANLGLEHALTDDAFRGMRDLWGWLYAPSPLGLLRWRPGAVEYVGPEVAGFLDSRLSAGLGSIRGLVSYGPWIYAFGTAGAWGAVLTLLAGTAGRGSIVRQLDWQSGAIAHHLDVLPAIGQRVGVSKNPIRDHANDFTIAGTDAVLSAQAIGDSLYILRDAVAEAYEIGSDGTVTRTSGRDLTVGATASMVFGMSSTLWVVDGISAEAYTIMDNVAPVRNSARDVTLPLLPDDGTYITAAVVSDIAYLFNDTNTLATCFDISGSGVPARASRHEFDAGQRVDGAGSQGSTLWLLFGSAARGYLTGTDAPIRDHTLGLTLPEVAHGAFGFGQRIWFVGGAGGLAWLLPTAQEQRVGRPWLLALSSEPDGSNTAFTLQARELPLTALTPGEGDLNRTTTRAEWRSPRITAPTTTVPKAYEAVEFRIEHEGEAGFLPTVEAHFPLEEFVALTPQDTPGDGVKRYLFPASTGQQPWCQVRIRWDGSDARRATIRGAMLYGWYRPRTERRITARLLLLRDPAAAGGTPQAQQAILEDLVSDQQGIVTFTDPQGVDYNVVVTNVSFRQLRSQESEIPEWTAEVAMTEVSAA